MKRYMLQFSKDRKVHWGDQLAGEIMPMPSSDILGKWKYIPDIDSYRCPLVLRDTCQYPTQHEIKGFLRRALRTINVQYNIYSPQG